jgi:putative hemolysin
MALWGALGKYMMRHRLDTMIGCASIGLADGGRQAHALWQHLRSTHLVASAWQVAPLRPLAVAGAAGDWAAPGGRAEMPPLLKGYLRCGASVLGAPAHDAAFNTADLPIMLRIDDMSARYREQFLVR